MRRAACVVHRPKPQKRTVSDLSAKKDVLASSVRLYINAHDLAKTLEDGADVRCSVVDLSVLVVLVKEEESVSVS
jgi:hypothetical protein